MKKRHSNLSSSLGKKGKMKRPQLGKLPPLYRFFKIRSAKYQAPVCPFPRLCLRFSASASAILLAMISRKALVKASSWVAPVTVAPMPGTVATKWSPTCSTSIVCSVSIMLVLTLTKVDTKWLVSVATSCAFHTCENQYGIVSHYFFSTSSRCFATCNSTTLWCIHTPIRSIALILPKSELAL